MRRLRKTKLTYTYFSFRKCVSRSHILVGPYTPTRIDTDSICKSGFWICFDPAIASE